MAPRPNPFVERVDHLIAAHGYAVITVGEACSVPGCAGDHGDEVWTYTIGLVEAGAPELVVTGLAGVHARQLIREVDLRRRSLRPVPAGAPQWFGSVPVVLRPVPHEWLATDPGRMAQWMHQYASGPASVALPDVVQVVWGDADGAFPGEVACDPLVAEDQVVLADDPFGFPRVPNRAARRRAGRHPRLHQGGARRSA